MKNMRRIPEVRESFGVLSVEADTLEEAMKKVYLKPNEFPLPENKYHIDETFKMSLPDELNVLSDENVDYVRQYHNM